MAIEKLNRVTLSDVAQRAGVSKNAVSSVINQSRVGTRVSDSTRERIQAAAAELNYYPNVAAQSLMGKRMNTVGVVFYNTEASPIESPYFAPILKGITAGAARHHQDTMLFTGHSWQDARHSLSIFCDGRCDGLLLVGPHTITDIVPSLLERGLPFVIINNRWDEPSADLVDVEDAASAQQMTEYLLDLGHRRIAMLCGDEIIGCVPRRRDGYLRALRERGIAADPGWVLAGGFYEPTITERLVLLASLPPEVRPTALICTNDTMALEALTILPKLGLRVPEDISVAGFDDIAPSAVSDPPLTTMRQPFRLLGERAIDLLLSRIEGRQEAAQEFFSTDLIVRRSTTPPWTGTLNHLI